MIEHYMLPATPILHVRLRGQKKLRHMQLAKMDDRDAWIMLSLELQKQSDHFYFTGTQVVLGTREVQE